MLIDLRAKARARTTIGQNDKLIVSMSRIGLVEIFETSVAELVISTNSIVLSVDYDVMVERWVREMHMLRVPTDDLNKAYTKHLSIQFGDLEILRMNGFPILTSKELNTCKFQSSDPLIKLVDYQIHS